LVQVQNGLYTPLDFIDGLREKFFEHDQYDSNVPLTVASSYALNYYKDQYLNFYQGGALAAMALDLYLIEISGGTMQLADLLRNLAAVFPADTFFNDADLFQIMGSLSYPQVEEFMVRHVKASEPFPWERLFANVGLLYRQEGETMGWSFGCDDISYNLENNRFMVSSEEGIDDFGKALGLRELDEIITINGDSLSLGSWQTTLNNFYSTQKEGLAVEMRIARPRKRGSAYREKTLKAKAFEVAYIEAHQLNLMPIPNPRQLRLQQIWLNQ
jgi:predicted metalloprotease with PDZ domain